MTIGIYVVGSFVLLWELSTGIVDVFPCWPVSRYWDPTIQAQWCVDMPDFFFGKAIPNIIGDFAILILPIHPVWNLKISTREKIILSCMFLVGSLYVFFFPLFSTLYLPILTLLFIIAQECYTNCILYSACICSIIRLQALLQLDFTDISCKPSFKNPPSKKKNKTKFKGPC
jgi:hypothetical protein